MNTVNINKYSIFDDTGKNVTSNVSDILELLDEANSDMKKLNSEDVFYGPICNSAVSGWEKIYSSLREDTNALLKDPTTLSNILNNYKTTDKTTENDIGSVH